jgi:hypothetical protein
MSEINLISPYCCLSGKYCLSNSLFVEGYLIGILSLIILIIIIELFDILIDIDKKKRE